MNKLTQHIFPKGGFFILFLFLLIPALTSRGQYPDTIVMSHHMIGDASVAARKLIKHVPGFNARAGLNYRAYIDSTFSGNGSNYDPPPEPQEISLSPSDMNYIITHTPQVEKYDPTVTHTSEKVAVDIKYFDGLGREIQDVSVMASPDQRDMIKALSYDNVGRSDTNYLPYESTDHQGGQFDASYATNQKAFIQTMFGQSNADYGYLGFVYEESPLNRVLKQSAPGVAWSFKTDPNQEHVVVTDYSVNATNVSSWKTNGSSFQSLSYGPGELFVNTTNNENRGMTNPGTTIEYKDKSGNVVITENLTIGGSYLTRYIYDDFNWLRCVVPPKATTPNGSPAINDLCYYYNYDKRHRTVMKKLPGADSLLMVYDKRDRPVMTQDGKMRAEDPKKWILTCYDNFNRPVMTGIYIHGSALNRVQMQNCYDNNVTNLNESINGNYNNTQHGYTRNVVTSLGTGNSYEVLTVTYYDNYAFVPVSHEFDHDNGIVNENKRLESPKNLVTGSKVKVMSDETMLKEWMLAVNYYDSLYRIIQTVADNPVADGMDFVSKSYSFTGQILAQKTKQRAFADSVEYVERFNYDHAGRLLEHTMDGLAEEPEIMMASMHYDKLGQLATKQIHAEKTGENSYNPFMQKTEYLYNIRGWMTSINNPDNTMAKNDIFAMRLHYNDALSMVTSQVQYNGNISALEWATNRPDEKFAYRFLYDKVNRLTTGEFYRDDNGGYMPEDSYNEKNITYDANGNILTLDRYNGEALKVDQMTYSYLENGNQIGYVQDAMGGKNAQIDQPITL